MCLIQLETSPIVLKSLLPEQSSFFDPISITVDNGNIHWVICRISASFP